MANEPQLQEWHWRDTMRPARFFMFDARSALVVVILIFHPRLYTVVFFVIFMFLFYLLERVGLTFEAALRRMRSWLAGVERPAIIWTARRRMMDLGGSDS